MIDIPGELTIPTLPSNSQIWIYPNPSYGYLILELDQSLSVGSKLEISDYCGRILLQKDLEEGIRHYLDLTHLRKGIYLLRIQNKPDNYLKKIVIQ